MSKPALPAPALSFGAPIPLSGAQKTALLLLLLEEDQAAAVLSRLSPEEVEAVGRAMLDVAEANPATVDRLLDEVLALADETVAVGEGGATVRRMLGRALGPDRAGGMIDRLGQRAKPPAFEGLAWLEPFAIASLLEGEHPQAQALVLVHLPPERAARVLAQLPRDRQPDLVRRVAVMGAVAPHVVEALDRGLARRMAACPPRQPVTDMGGMRRAADLINMAGIDEEAALSVLGAVDPEAADVLAETLFTFEDLARLDDRALQTVIRQMEADLLVPALRAAEASLRERILKAMPQRAAQALQDEIDSRGPVKVEEAEAAKKAIAAATRRLAAEGVISLPGKGPAYV
ncbi:MAG: flagellar motor switch protein FliG [Sphingomonadaceae bacterium]|uniref:flagellar motor switch protein FliG n=1 Tax=Thermaurantiacus sp. TaxID=2820283 RepID=UPI00298EEE16|nr:flagellar motor switch protein FliG [Thermaurantiacus sp.]MCS6987012.1 flagellar motor switch protein FliG [Sphingomonadaceae bacterium]MDW8415650.1 flagellar motor switch protein FliG [Thermaurantiacus sp.]